jgi:hypothetical protein
MACRWMNDKEIGRWYLPECWGGLYDIEGCYCDRSSPNDEVEQLKKRVQKLEKIVAHICPDKSADI